MASASCNCGDFAPDRWCKHVAAVGYQLVTFCEVDPFYPFFLRQLDITGAVLPKILPRKRAREPLPAGEVIELSDSDDVGGLDAEGFENAGSSREHTIVCN